MGFGRAGGAKAAAAVAAGKPVKKVQKKVAAGKYTPQYTPPPAAKSVGTGVAKAAVSTGKAAVATQAAAHQQRVVDHYVTQAAKDSIAKSSSTPQEAVAKAKTIIPQIKQHRDALMKAPTIKRANAQGKVLNANQVAKVHRIEVKPILGIPQARVTKSKQLGYKVSGGLGLSKPGTSEKIASLQATKEQTRFGAVGGTPKPRAEKSPVTGKGPRATAKAEAGARKKADPGFVGPLLTAAALSPLGPEDLIAAGVAKLGSKALPKVAEKVASLGGKESKATYDSFKAERAAKAEEKAAGKMTPRERVRNRYTSRTGRPKALRPAGRKAITYGAAYGAATHPKSEAKSVADVGKFAAEVATHPGDIPHAGKAIAGTLAHTIANLASSGKVRGETLYGLESYAASAVGFPFVFAHEAETKGPATASKEFVKQFTEPLKPGWKGNYAQLKRQQEKSGGGGAVPALTAALPPAILLSRGAGRAAEFGLRKGGKEEAARAIRTRPDKRYGTGAAEVRGQHAAAGIITRGIQALHDYARQKAQEQRVKSAGKKSKQVRVPTQKGEVAPLSGHIGRYMGRRHAALITKRQEVVQGRLAKRGLGHQGRLRQGGEKLLGSEGGGPKPGLRYLIGKYTDLKGKAFSHSTRLGVPETPQALIDSLEARRNMILDHQHEHPEGGKQLGEIDKLIRDVRRNPKDYGAEFQGHVARAQEINRAGEAHSTLIEQEQARTHALAQQAEVLSHHHGAETPSIHALGPTETGKATIARDTARRTHGELKSQLGRTEKALETQKKKAAQAKGAASKAARGSVEKIKAKRDDLASQLKSKEQEIAKRQKLLEKAKRPETRQAHRARIAALRRDLRSSRLRERARAADRAFTRKQKAVDALTKEEKALAKLKDQHGKLKGNHQEAAQALAKAERSLNEARVREGPKGADRTDLFARNWQDDANAYARKFEPQIQEAARKVGLGEPSYFPDTRRGFNEPRAPGDRAGYIPKKSKGILFRSGASNEEPLRLFEQRQRVYRANTAAAIHTEASGALTSSVDTWRKGYDTPYKHIPEEKLTGKQIVDELYASGAPVEHLRMWNPDLWAKRAGISERAAAEPEAIAKHMDEAMNGASFHITEDAHPEELAARGWKVIDANEFKQLREQMRTDIGNGERIYGRLKNLATRALLGTNPSWLMFQVYANAFLTGIAEPGALKPGLQWAKWMNEMPKNVRDNFEAAIGVDVHNVDYGNMGGSLLASHLAFTKTAFYRSHLEGRNPLDVLLRGDTTNNRYWRSRVLTTKVKREAWKSMGDHMTNMQKVWAKIQDASGIHDAMKMPEFRKAANKVVMDQKTMEHLARETNQFLGDYTTFTRGERKWLSNNVLFYGFLRHSLMLALWSLPIRHPLRGALLASAGQFAEKKTKQYLTTAARAQFRDFATNYLGLNPKAANELSHHLTLDGNKLPFSMMGSVVTPNGSTIDLKRASVIGSVAFQTQHPYQLISALNPVIPAVFSFLTGYSSFTGSPIQTAVKSGGFGKLRTMPIDDWLKLQAITGLGYIRPIRDLSQVVSKYPSFERTGTSFPLPGINPFPEQPLQWSTKQRQQEQQYNRGYQVAHSSAKDVFGPEIMPFLPHQGNPIVASVVWDFLNKVQAHAKLIGQSYGHGSPPSLSTTWNRDLPPGKYGYGYHQHGFKAHAAGSGATGGYKTGTSTSSGGYKSGAGYKGSTSSSSGKSPSTSAPPTWFNQISRALSLVYPEPFIRSQQRGKQQDQQQQQARAQAVKQATQPNAKIPKIPDGKMLVIDASGKRHWESLPGTGSGRGQGYLSMPAGKFVTQPSAANSPHTPSVLATANMLNRQGVNADAALKTAQNLSAQQRKMLVGHVAADTVNVKANKAQQHANQTLAVKLSSYGMTPAKVAAVANAARKFGVAPEVLVAIGNAESTNGTSTMAGVHSGQNGSGAAGPFQMGNGTGDAGDSWQTYSAQLWGKKASQHSVYNYHDAAMTAAAYLKAAGWSNDPAAQRNAVLAYNHLDSYANGVLQTAASVKSRLWNKAGGAPVMGAGGGKVTVKGKGRYVFPFPENKGWTFSRTDMGTDYGYGANAGAPIRALGSGKVVKLGDPFGYHNGVLFKLDKAQGLPSPYIYVYEGLDPTVKAGQRIRKGQTIGVGSTTGSIEIGFADANGNALAHDHYVEGQATAEGKAMTTFLTMIQKGKTRIPARFLQVGGTMQPVSGGVVSTGGMVAPAGTPTSASSIPGVSALPRATQKQSQQMTSQNMLKMLRLIQGRGAPGGTNRLLGLPSSGVVPATTSVSSDLSALTTRLKSRQKQLTK